MFYSVTSRGAAGARLVGRRGDEGFGLDFREAAPRRSRVQARGQRPDDAKAPRSPFANKLLHVIV